MVKIAKNPMGQEVPIEVTPGIFDVVGIGRRHNYRHLPRQTPRLEAFFKPIFRAIRRIFPTNW